MVKDTLVLKVTKLGTFIVLVFQIFLNLDKFLDLNLGKFQLVHFYFFFILLYLPLATPSSSIISTNSGKCFANFVKVVLTIDINRLAILLKS